MWPLPGDLDDTQAGSAGCSGASTIGRGFPGRCRTWPGSGGRRRIVAVHTRAETLRPLVARLGLDVPPA